MKGEIRFMKKRTKKIIALLLAIVLAISLMPIAALAEGETTPAVPAAVEEPAEEPADPGTVYVVVYGSALTEAIDAITTDGKLFEPTYSWGRENGDNGTAGAIKSVTDTIPTVDIVLIAEDGTEVALNEATDLKGSALVSDVREEGVDSYAAELDKMSASGYKVFTADVEPGTYTVSVKAVEEPYGLANTTYLSSSVTVEAGQTVFAGDTKAVKGYSERTEQVWVGSHTERQWSWSQFKYVDVVVDDYETQTFQDSHTLNFTGYFLRKETRAFSFTTTDVAGAPVQGSEFVLVNRDELLGLMKPIIGVGKEVFTTAVKNLGNPDVFSFEELVQLHTNLLKQNEQGYIAIDPEAAYGIVKAYLALLTDADIVGQFIERDENGNFVKLAQPLPAVLSATSDENGVVHFSAENNVTLTWLITIITDFGADILEGLAVNNPLLQALLPLVKGFQIINHIEDIDFNTISAKELIDLLNSIPDFGNETFSTIKSTILSAAENNSDNLDAIMNNSLVRWGIEQLGGILVGAKGYILDFVYSTLQNFGIVGEKFSNGNYMLFQFKAPEEYARNPLVYTLNIKWTEPDNFYVTVVDLGLVGPYFAEGFYEFVRNTTYEGPIATALGITANNYGFASKLLSNQIDLTKKVNQQVQGAFSAYAADALYKALGLDVIFNSKLMFMQGINDYLLEDKNAAADLRTYLNAQVKRAKSVYTSVVDEDWVFYTLDASPTTTATKLINKSTEDIAATMPNGSAKQLGVKENGTRVAKIVQTIGTRIEATNAKIVESVKSAFTKVFGDISARITDSVKKIVASLFSTIFGGGSNNTANA